MTKSFTLFIFMKKPFTYTAIAVLVFFACIPPINFFISRPENDLWYVMILMAAFFGFYLWFMDVNWIISIVALWSFINCFFSASPPIAFTSYVPIVMGCYFYWICLNIEDHELMLRIFLTLFFLNCFFLIMQFMGWDSLLNFGLGHDVTCFGVIGQHMQMGSFSVILAALLLSLSAAYLSIPFVIGLVCGSTWTIFTATIGLLIWICDKKRKWAKVYFTLAMMIFLVCSLSMGKFSSNLTGENGRMDVWKKSVELAFKRPIFGWGPGTYKIFYPALTLSAKHETPYKAAHNWIIQLLFEMGIPFTFFIVTVIEYLAYFLWKEKETVLLTGLTLICVDGLVHFPERMLQSVGLIIYFLAYCENKLKKNIS